MHIKKCVLNRRQQNSTHTLFSYEEAVCWQLCCTWEPTVHSEQCCQHMSRLCDWLWSQDSMFATVARLKTAQENVLRHVDKLNSCKKKKKKGDDKRGYGKLCAWWRWTGRTKTEISIVAGDNLFVSEFMGNSVYLMSSEGRRDWDAKKEETVSGKPLNDNEVKCLKYKSWRIYLV